MPRFREEAEIRAFDKMEKALKLVDAAHQMVLDDPSDAALAALDNARRVHIAASREMLNTRQLPSFYRNTR